MQQNTSKPVSCNCPSFSEEILSIHLKLGKTGVTFAAES